MGTGGKPPRMPQQAKAGGTSSSPPASGAKLSGDVFRPTGVNAELEALKQRGLAKILNKHFTETAQRLAEEKAAADAALADLEQRKANTSEFHASGNGELSPLDSLYVSVNNWRNECRKKERETLLLYQRYVDKYGSTGQVRPPDAALVPTAKTKEARSWIIKDDGSVSGPAPAAPSLPPAQLVPTIAAEIERTLEENIQKGALRLPSNELLGIEETFHTVQEKQAAEFRNFYRKQLQQRNIDARSPQRTLGRKDAFLGPGWVSAMGPGITPKQFYQSSNGGQAIGGVNKTKSTGVNSNKVKQKDSDSDEDREDDNDDDEFEYDPDLPLDSAAILNAMNDDCSVVSGLTSIHSQITRSVIHDCERTVYEFLTEERSYIQKLIAEEEAKAAAEEIRIGNNVQASNVQTAEAENMVQQMQDILHEYQMKNLHDLPNQQHEARRFITNNPDEHWMVYYDEFYQQEYYHELNSNRTQWEPPCQDGTNNENGENGGLKDASSTSVSENTAAVSASAHPCDSVSVASRGSHHAVLLSSDDVMPDQRSGMFAPQKTGRRSTYESRIAQFRRKRKRERRRKLVASVFVSIALVVVGVRYYNKYQSSFIETVDNTLPRATTVIVDEKPSKIIAASTTMPSTSTASATLEKIQQAASNVLETSSDAASKMILSFEQEIIAKVLQIDPEHGLASCDHHETNVKTKGQKGLTRRPWGCNIPFAYLFHKGCATLAKQQPVFDLSALILSMLQ